MTSSARSPAKPGYPIGKVAFIEGYKNINGRPHAPTSPAEYALNPSHRLHRPPFQPGAASGADTSVATASGIDPRLIRLYNEIEACVQGIQAIRQQLTTIPVVEDELDI